MKKNLQSCKIYFFKIIQDTDTYFENIYDRCFHIINFQILSKILTLYFFLTTELSYFFYKFKLIENK